MKISVLGTGGVGNAIATKLIEVGHQVMMGSRTALNEKAMAFVGKQNNGKASAGTFAEAAAFGEIIFNCTSGQATLDVLKLAGDNNLNGKVLIDISNPLDFSQGMPPSLFVCNTTSLAEEIQNTFPKVNVVKTLNTLTAALMVNPTKLNNADHNLFICGNDGEAKKSAIEILVSFGWIEKNILDLGDITKARGMEMWLPLWLSIYSSTQNGMFNLKIVS